MVGRIRGFAEAHIAPTSRRDTETVAAGIETRIKLRAKRLRRSTPGCSRQGG